MKKNLFTLCLGAIFLLFSGCGHKELLTSKYYPNYTKDDILLAGKYAFLIDNDDEYIVDSYRDRLEATKIELVFHTLLHKDYMLKVEEDACGTLATLVLEGSFGANKTSKYYPSKYQHKKFWSKVALFIDKDRGDDNFIAPEKDMQACTVKDEFENGLVKDSVRNRFEVCDENK